MLFDSTTPGSWIAVAVLVVLLTFPSFTVSGKHVIEGVARVFVLGGIACGAVTLTVLTLFLVVVMGFVIKVLRRAD